MLVIAFASCSEKEPIIENDPLAPVIISLTSDKDTIVSGPEDPAIITCVAEGENLKYLWDVALGDVQIIEGSGGSVIKFTSADCCEGDKEIKCKVYNDHGEDNGVVNLFVIVEYF